MSLSGIFGRLFDPERREARKRVRSHFRSEHPDLRVTGVRLRASEPERWVFAAFYYDPDHPVRPPPYHLFAVDRHTGEVSALETSPDSPYWYQGRR